MEDWLGELDNIRKEDEQRQESVQLDLSVLGNQSDATKLLKQVDAHNVLRRANAVLLKNKGRIDFFDQAKQYDHCVGLVWQGPVSKARPPSPDDPTPFYYILVGVKRKTVYVNGKALQINTPEALKAALVGAAKKPGMQRRM